MAELVEFGNARARLCGVLAAAIARFLTRTDPAGCGRRGAAFYHESDPLLEDATRVLKELGLVEPVPRADAPGETWYCLHALRMDAEAMPGVLPATLADDAPHARLLVAFLRLACERDGLPSGRSFFPAPADYAAAMRALAAAGYAERRGGEFAWAARSAAAMREAGLWDGRRRSRAALRERERDAQAEAAWRSMPETIRRAHFAARPIGVVAVAEVLARSWRDGAWRPARPNEAMPPGHVALARRLIALADGRDRAQG